MVRKGAALIFGFVLVLCGASLSFALQSGGVEIGDLETGSVVGQPFKEIPVDLDFIAMEIGGKKVWYPPTSILNLRDRTGRPIVLRVTNATQAEHGFFLSADAEYSAPTSLNAKVVLKPGETKYIGIPTSDVTYVTAGGLLKYKCHIHEAHIGGQLLIMK